MTHQTAEDKFDVFAIRLDNGERRLLAECLTERNAEALIKLAIMRRGVEEEFYKIESIRE